MVMRSSGQSVSKGGTRKGVLLMLVLTAFSVLSINIFGRTVSFLFVPLIAVYLWPRVETPIASIVFILVFGLLLDLLSAGPLGLWALIFLSVFTLFGSHRRLKPHKFMSAFRLWIGALGFALASAFLLGWFAMSRQPDIWPLVYQAVAAIFLFPFVYGARNLGRNLLSSNE